MQIIALKNLRFWNENPRQNSDKEHIQSLKASIRTQGIFQNLVVCPSGEEGESYSVIAGESRLRALQELAAEGDIPDDHGVPCLVRPRDDVDNLTVALAENVIRRNMEPIDEAIAFADLAKKGVPEEAIAEAFGCTKNLVKRRLALGRLVPEAQEMIRKDVRDLGWGAAMAEADTSTQTKIVKDIDNDPNSWQTAHEIKRFLTKDGIEFEYALFDPADYKGEIYENLFDEKLFMDRAAFWELQDPEIEKLRESVESEGWQLIKVERQPVDLWRYELGAQPSDGLAIIEVLSTGKVTVHRGLSDPSGVMTTDATGADEDDEDVEEVPIGDAAYVGAAVRATPGVLAYCADQRSAMLQASLAEDKRASMEVMVSALIGHNEIPIHAVNHRFSGNPENRHSAAFDALAGMREELANLLEEMGLSDPSRRGSDVYYAVQQLDDTKLDRLFCLLTSLKVGQIKARRLDQQVDSFTNVLAARLKTEPRKGWRPTEEFFDLMSAADLRRIAQAILPMDRQIGIAGAKKPNLVRLLSDAFADAAEDSGVLAPEDRDRLNAWVPGPMAYPAVDERASSEEFEATEENPFDALFETQEQAA